MLRPRPIGTVLLAVATTLLMLFATLSTWVHFQVLAPDALGSNVRASLREPEVRDQLATEIARRVAQSDRRLFAAAPVVRQAAEILVTSRQFADVVEIAVQQVRIAVTTGDEVSSTRLADLETQLRQTLQVIDPSIAAQVPTNWDTSVVDLTDDAPVPRALRTGESVGKLWWLAIILTVAAAAGWIACSYTRRRALAALGVVLSFVGLTIVVARMIVGDRFADAVRPANRAALRAVYDVTTADLHRIGVAYLAAGAIVVAATVTGPLITSGLLIITTRFERLGRMPASPRVRAVWGIVVAMIGGALALASNRIGPAVAIVAGVVIAFAGINVLATSLPSTFPEQRFLSWRRALAFATIVSLLGGAIAIGRDTPRRQDAAAEPDERTLVCNGHADLCGKRLDEVTLAGTHNSMSAAESGFLFAEHTMSIRRQLETGARVLMLDLHYGVPTSRGLVLTDLVFNDRAALVTRYGEETVQNIEQLRSAVAQPTAPSSVYLCHIFCELGATPASIAFAEIRTFLARNPSEVLVLMLQDETEGEDTVRALEAAGLDDLAYAKPTNEPWPTLGELVRGGTPLIVLSQRDGGNPPWFKSMFSLVQDNPYTARSTLELSCRPNRGSLRADLFLMNHWISGPTPDIADARRINTQEFIVDRARQCEKERGQRVNFIAVNFWGAGNVLGAVDELNRDDR